MVKQIQYYLLTENGVPTDNDLIECLNIQKENPDKIIVLKYFKKWSGWFEVWFNDVKTLEEVKEKMPKYYCV